MGLVQRAPADDRGVVDVAGDRLDPLPDEGGGGLLVVAQRAETRDAPVPELAPGEIAVQVRPEEHALVEDLLVETGAVEAGLHREADVGGEGVVRRGGHERVLPVALVQDQALEDLLAVQAVLVGVEGGRAQARVGADLVEHGAVGIQQPHLQGVELGRAGAPHAHVLLGDRQRQVRGEVEVGADARARDLLPAGHGGDDLEAGAGGAARERHVDREGGGGERGDDPQGADLVGRHALEPDALPDAGGAVVVGVGGAEPGGLLAAGLGRIVRVAGADHDAHLVAGAEAGDLGEVGGEGGEAAAVAGDLDAVRPDGRVLVHRLEAEDRAQALPVRGDGEGAAVPDGLEEVAVADPGGRGLGREGHRDLVLERAAQQAALPARVAAVDLELPGPVEVQPGGALQLGARVLGAGHVGCGGERGVQLGRELVGSREQRGERLGQCGGRRGHRRGSWRVIGGDLSGVSQPQHLRMCNVGNPGRSAGGDAGRCGRTRWYLTCGVPHVAYEVTAA